MLEALWVLGALALLVGGGTATLVLPPHWLIIGGVVAMGAGCAFGLPAGFYYHVVLRRELLGAGTLPERWWLQPVRHHDALTDHARRRVMPWFYVGGAGFVLILVGAASVGLGLLRLDGHAEVGRVGEPSHESSGAWSSGQMVVTAQEGKDEHRT